MVKFIKFVVVGGAATLLQFFLLGLFVELGGLIPVVASAISYACSATFNYVANYYITFASQESHKQTLPKFIVAICIGLTFSTSAFAIALHALEKYILHNSHLLQSSYLIAQLFATLLTLILNFFIHKFWIYRR